jgi:serine/threonine protein kinase
MSCLTPALLAQMKIGDLGMARFVFPTSPASSASRSRSPSPLRCDPVVAVKAAARSPQHSHGGSSGYSSSPGTPKAPAARTFTPGIVGTITYTAPEVLGVLDEPQEQPDVEAVLKVCPTQAPVADCGRPLG